ncbi:MAG: PIG-L deacetylase family protein [Gemmatimonadota bacterium]
MNRYDADYVPSSALAIFAHPDDAEFTVAGTLAKWARAGCEISVVLITSGNAGTHDPAWSREELARTREKETRAAMEVLGVRRVAFLGQNDCEVANTLDLRRRLVREIRARRPEVVICGDPQAWLFGDRYVNHPDHRAAAAAALEAAFPCAEMELLWPLEGAAHAIRAIYLSSAVEPNTRIDITETIDVKIAALRRHESQLGDRDPSEMIRGWAGDEARKARAGARRGKSTAAARKVPKYCEAFRIMRIRQREEEPEAGG